MLRKSSKLLPINRFESFKSPRESRYIVASTITPSNIEIGVWGWGGRGGEGGGLARGDREINEINGEVPNLSALFMSS